MFAEAGVYAHLPCLGWSHSSEQPHQGHRRVHTEIRSCMYTIAQVGSQKKKLESLSPLAGQISVFQWKEEAGGNTRVGSPRARSRAHPLQSKHSGRLGCSKRRHFMLPHPCAAVFACRPGHSEMSHHCLPLVLDSGTWHWRAVPMLLSLAFKSSACNLRDPSVRAGRGLGEWGGHLRFTQRV